MRHLLVQFLAMRVFWSLPMVGAFDPSVNTNLAIYWGQNSYGATHLNDTANWQKRLKYYCEDDRTPTDIIPVAFLTNFNPGGLPTVNLANICNFGPGSPTNCAFLAEDIETCQNKGKIVTISLGGANAATTFKDDDEGKAYAQTIWDLFLGGKSTTRPFGNAVLDGIDMDIEGGTQTGYKAFLTTLRKLMDGGSKPYYISAAPQCPYPDYWIGATLNAVPFDAVFVQFYNNYCGLDHYDNPNDWNFGTWDNWAKTTSPNPKVKVFIGAPASSTAAGSGYVNPSTIAKIINETQCKYTSFGGAMLWDMSQAYVNDRYDIAVKNALVGGSCADKVSPWQSNVAALTGGCDSVPAWDSDEEYIRGDQVTYKGHFWFAQWSTRDDVPGGPAGVWVDEGPCDSYGTAVSEDQGLVVQEAFGILPEAVELVWDFMTEVANGLPGMGGP